MFETTNQIFSSTPSCCAGIFALHDLRLHRIRSWDQHHRNAARTGLTSAHRRHEPIRIPWEVRMGVIAPHSPIDIHGPMDVWGWINSLEALGCLGSQEYDST